MRTTSRFAFWRAVWLLPMTMLLAAPAAASRPVAPRLVVAAPLESPIVLQKVAVSGEVTGGLAVTSVEMVFYNPNQRSLEGELQFPLLDGQQIVSFALDVDGKLREAVPVPKSRGQQVFEDIARQRVDPGLLQVTQGSNFKVRVYPILAQRTRTVVIRYSESLASRGARAVYRLPLEYGDKVGEFSLALSVRGATGRPVLRGATAGEPAFTAVPGGYELKARYRDHAPHDVLEVSVGVPPGARTLTQEHDGRRYFHTELPVGTSKVARALPEVLGIIWDSSGSGAGRNHARELALLDAYFARMRDGEVRLTRIRDAAEPAGLFRITNGEWRELRRALEATVYDGATNFGAFVPDAAVGEYLLFSDGLANFGDGGLPETPVPLHAISSAVQANPALLRHLAHRSGGRYVDLAAEAPRAAVEKLVNAFERALAVTSEGALELKLMSPYPRNGRLEIAGVLVDPAATLRVTLGVPGRAPRTIAVPVGKETTQSGLAASFWARARVAELEADYSVHRSEIQRVGQSFGIVTRETSLIVLEFIQDYVRFEIAPPQELAAQYGEMRRSMGLAAAPDRQRKIDDIVALLNEKEAWWKREFSKGTLPAPMEDRALRRGDHLRLGARAEGDVVRAPAAPMARPAPQAALKSAPAEAKVSGGAQAGDALAASREERAGASQQGLAQNLRPLDGKPRRALDSVRDRAFDVAQLNPWSPDAPYLSRLRNAEASEAYRVYLDERAGFAATPAFFVETADVLAAKGLHALALRVLSNLAEIDLENRHLLRTLGQRLTQAGEARLALGVFKRVAELAPEEPQSFRDLGLAYAAAGDAQRAIDALYEVVVRPWHARFPQIELVALADLNAIAGAGKGRLDVSRIDARLLRNLPLDLRVVLTWDSDNTDVNLLVTDPNGQQSRPGGPVTQQGGRASLNFSGGYGPEEYSLRAAKPGTYRIAAQFAGSRQQVAGAGATHAHVRVYTGFGTPRQAEHAFSVLLARPGEMATLAEIVIPGEPLDE